MAWPRTGAGVGTGGGGYSTTYATGAASYFRWGTYGAVVGWENYTILSINQRQKKDTLHFENGDGVQNGRMQLFHGTTWEIRVRDDTRLSKPTAATYMTITDLAGHLGNIAATYSAYVLDSDYEIAPKEPGVRVITVEKLTLITLG
jgi:hypothetical protein